MAEADDIASVLGELLQSYGERVICTPHMQDVAAGIAHSLCAAQVIRLAPASETLSYAHILSDYRALYVYTSLILLSRCQMPEHSGCWLGCWRHGRAQTSQWGCHPSAQSPSWILWRHCGT